MPDHLHLLLEGETRDSDIKKLIAVFKQASGYQYGQNADQYFSTAEKPKLWQPSFYDHVLRKEEALEEGTRYVLNNPVRKGLVKHYKEYEFSGSFVLADGKAGM